MSIKMMHRTPFRSEWNVDSTIYAFMAVDLGQLHWTTPRKIDASKGPGLQNHQS